jgi:hypothetical protein
MDMVIPTLVDPSMAPPFATTFHSRRRLPNAIQNTP